MLEKIITMGQDPNEITDPNVKKYGPMFPEDLWSE